MNNMLESLNRGLETKYFGGILDEAIYGGRKWSNLSDEERQKCLDSDPTYNGKEDSAGKYSEWIFKIYSDFKKNHPSGKFRFDHCKDVLTQFMRSKDNLEDETNKDINKFKSLDELDTFLNNSQNFANTFVEIPEENSIKGAKKIFENDRCEIWVPLTHAASRAIAGEPKTKWCTAYSNPGYYKDYTKKGPLFILIMKDNSGDMYQFHFETKAAMDKYDGEVTWENFPEMDSQEVKNFREEYFKEKDDATCKQLDSLLDKETHLPKSGADVNKAEELIRSIHNEDLALKYSEPFDEWCLEQFYTNLTSTLTKDSPSIKYLKRCVGKVNITLPDTVASMGEGCFSRCTSLKSITIPGSVMGISGYCFCECRSLKSITIPNSVVSIGRYCFSDCESLESITIPNSVTSLGNYCFGGCKFLKNINIPNSVTNIENDCFHGCTSLTSITIPNSVTRLGWHCFCFCTSLKSITIPNSVTSLEPSCFHGCESLTSITIPDGVTSVGAWCFCGCESLKSITIPSSVMSIGNDCFLNCKSLKEVHYSGSQEDRVKIRIGGYNDTLLNATWYYNWEVK